MEIGGTMKISQYSKVRGCSSVTHPKWRRRAFALKQQIHFAFLMSHEAALSWINCVKPQIRNALKLYSQQPEPEE